MSKNNKHLVAVYGSLLQGLHNHKHYLADATYIGEFDSEPIYTLYDLGSFPGLKKGGHTSVRMEVYKIDEQQLKSIDNLEGFRPTDTHNNNHYNRTSIKTPYGYAYGYLYNPSAKNCKIVSNGDWRDHFNTKSIVYV